MLPEGAKSRTGTLVTAALATTSCSSRWSQALQQGGDPDTRARGHQAAEPRAREPDRWEDQDASRSLVRRAV